MAAGVHDAGVLRFPRAAGGLGDGQGVDIGAQDDGAVLFFGGFRSPEGCQYAGFGDPAVFDSDPVELRFDEGGRRIFPEREFGMGVQVPSEFDGGHFSFTFHEDLKKRLRGPDAVTGPDPRVWLCQKIVDTIFWMLVVRLIV